MKVKDARLLDGISARELERRLVGIRSTERHGKHLIAGLDDRRALILRFGITGTIETSAEGVVAPRYEVLHIRLGKDRWASVTSRRKLGHIWLNEDVAAFLKQHGQGPDALAKPLDAEAFETPLGSKLHPLTLVGDLDRNQLGSLCQTMARVLRQAIARNLMAEAPGSAFPDDWLSAHREAGGCCPRCGTLSGARSKAAG